MKNSICSICKEIIQPDPDGWNGGHNAQPVNDGKCCYVCNERVVTPTRLLIHNKNKEKENEKRENKQSLGS